MWLYAAVALHVVIAISFVSLLLYYNYKSNTIAVKIATEIDKYLKPFGYDAAPFLPVWYNGMSSIVKLDYPDNTVCVVVLSNQNMFENALPLYLASDQTSTGDPVDSCTKHFIEKARALFPDEEVDIIYDFDLQPNTRLPLLNMQTVGHAAGLAYFYRPAEITEHNWGDKKMFGCSISPKYGGWFGYRAVLVFKNIQDDMIQYLSPHDSLNSQEEKKNVIELFNNDWKNPAWRDVVYTDERYSSEQLEYFNCMPAERGPLINKIMKRYLEEKEQEEEREMENEMKKEL